MLYSHPYLLYIPTVFFQNVPRFGSLWKLHNFRSWERRVKCQVNCLCDSADFDVTGSRLQSPLWRTPWWHQVKSSVMKWRKWASKRKLQHSSEANNVTREGWKRTGIPWTETIKQHMWHQKSAPFCRQFSLHFNVDWRVLAKLSVFEASLAMYISDEFRSVCSMLSMVFCFWRTELPTSRQRSPKRSCLYHV